MNKVREFDFSTLKGQKQCYIHMYLLINGIMEIDKLLSILVANHGFKMNRIELIELVKELSDLQIINNYVCISGIKEPLVYQFMQYKNMIGDYKIIDNLEKMEKEYNKSVIDIDKICEEFFEDYLVFDMLKSLMFLGRIDIKTFNTILKDTKIILSNKDKLLLFRKLEEYQKNMRIWWYNGFTEKELIEIKGNIPE